MSIADSEPQRGMHDELDTGSGRVLSEIKRDFLVGVRLIPGGKMAAVDNRVVLSAILDKEGLPKLLVSRPTVMPVIKEKRGGPPVTCYSYPPEELESRLGEIASLEVSFGPAVRAVYIGDRYALRRVHSEEAIVFDLYSTEEVIVERHKGNDPLGLLEAILDKEKY